MTPAEHDQLQRVAVLPPEPQRPVPETPVHRVPGLVDLTQKVPVPRILELGHEDEHLIVVPSTDQRRILRIGKREKHPTASHRRIIETDGSPATSGGFPKLMSLRSPASRH